MAFYQNNKWSLYRGPCSHPSDTGSMTCRSEGGIGLIGLLPNYEYIIITCIVLISHYQLRVVLNYVGMKDL